MKDFDISKWFCEVLGGLVAILTTLGVLDISGVLTLSKVWDWLTKDFTFGKAVGLLIFSYLIGLVLDAFGLVFDVLVVDRWKVVKERDKASLARFYASAKQHIFDYWKEQWAYFSLYRNLCMCMFLGLIVWPLVVQKYLGWIEAGLAFVVVLFIIAILLYVMHMLLKLCYHIESYF